MFYLCSVFVPRDWRFTLSVTSIRVLERHENHMDFLEVATTLQNEDSARYFGSGRLLK